MGEEVRATLCLHHNDADGRASGAIVRRALGQEVRLYEVNYGDSLPWQELLAAEHVLIVDFSLPKADMLQLAAGRKLTWIDHHISALQEMQDVALHWPGIRSIDEAACVLTWRYFFPDQPLPRAVILIGDRDIWRMAETDTRPFNEGFYQENTRPDNDSFWEALLSDDHELVNGLIERGQIFLEARMRTIRRYVKHYGFAVRFEGCRTMAVNRNGDGDLGEYIRNLGYDIAYCYIDGEQNGRLMTFVTLFSNSVDVSVIAQKFGGGGHRGAAGFSFERAASPFPSGATVEKLD